MLQQCRSLRPAHRSLHRVCLAVTLVCLHLLAPIQAPLHLRDGVPLVAAESSTTATSGQRYVIFIDGINSSGGNVKGDFQAYSTVISGIDPSVKFVYFSYAHGAAASPIPFTVGLQIRSQVPIPSMRRRTHERGLSGISGPPYSG